MPDDIFYGTSGPHDADIMIVGESWGSEEEQQRQPFVGASGKELTAMLAEAGIKRENCFLTNVVPYRPPQNKMFLLFTPTREAHKKLEPSVRGLYPTKVVGDGLRTLDRQIEAVKPKIIIGFGNYSLWALTDDCFGIGNSSAPAGYKIPTGIIRWRGSQLFTRHGIPFVPTYHPAAILRQWAWRRIAVHDLRERPKKLLPIGKWPEPEWDFIIRPSFEQVMEKIAWLKANIKAISVDLETRGHHIACMCLAWSETEAISIPLMCVEDNNGYWSYREEVEIILALKDYLSAPETYIIGQNFLYDAQYIARYWGFIPKIGFDTLVAQRLCWPGLPKGLDFLSSMYCAFHRYWKDEGKNWDWGVPEDQLWTYNCKDGVATYEIWKVLISLIGHLNLAEQWEWERDQLDLMLDMMLRGVKIDLEARAAMTKELDEAIKSRVEVLKEIIPWGNELKQEMKNPKNAAGWYYSQKQQVSLFYDHLGLKEIRNRKTGKPRVDDDALETIATREPLLGPLVQLMRELRSCRVFNNTFLKAELDEDNRMRCEYGPQPETFRWNSRENVFGTGTNLQNIPAGTED